MGRFGRLYIYNKRWRNNAVIKGGAFEKGKEEKNNGNSHVGQWVGENDIVGPTGILATENVVGEDAVNRRFVGNFFWVSTHNLYLSPHCTHSEEGAF